MAGLRHVFLLCSENRTTGWVSPPEAERPITGQKFIKASFGEQLLHTDSGTHSPAWWSMWLFRAWEPLYLAFLLTKHSAAGCPTHSVDVLMFVSWFQVMFYWGFNRSVPSGYLLNECPSSSSLLGTIILIAHCNSSIKFQGAVHLILPRTESNAHQENEQHSFNFSLCV